MASQIVNGCMACSAPRPSYRRSYRKKRTYGRKRAYKKKYTRKGAVKEKKKVNKIVRDVKTYGEVPKVMERANRHLEALNKRTASYIERIRKAAGQINSMMDTSAVGGGGLSDGRSSSFKRANLASDIAAA